MFQESEKAAESFGDKLGRTMDALQRTHELQDLEIELKLNVEDARKELMGLIPRRNASEIAKGISDSLKKAIDLANELKKAKDNFKEMKGFALGEISIAPQLEKLKKLMDPKAFEAVSDQVEEAQVKMIKSFKDRTKSDIDVLENYKKDIKSITGEVFNELAKMSWSEWAESGDSMSMKTIGKQIAGGFIAPAGTFIPDVSTEVGGIMTEMEAAFDKIANEEGLLSSIRKKSVGYLETSEDAWKKIQALSSQTFLERKSLILAAREGLAELGESSVAKLLRETKESQKALNELFGQTEGTKGDRKLLVQANTKLLEDALAKLKGSVDKNTEVVSKGGIVQEGNRIANVMEAVRQAQEQIAKAPEDDAKSGAEIVAAIKSLERAMKNQTIIGSFTP
jgi:hypothetical protein